MRKLHDEFQAGQHHGITDPMIDGLIVHSHTRVYSVDEVIAGNTTPLVLVSSPLAGFALVFLELVLNLHDGTTNYDQNQNAIVKYQTAGGGVTVSTTLANFLDGSAAGALTTIKQLTTDIVPEEAQDLVLTLSASPFAAAGDRQLSATPRYYVVPVVTTT